MIRLKNALFAHFHGKLAKLKIFHAKFRLFLFNLIFWNNKNIYKKINKLKKIFSKKIMFKKSSSGVLGSDVLG